MYNQRPPFRRKKYRMLFVLFIPLLLLLLSAVVMLLWNAILPAVLHANNISFWQAAGLLLLSRILFGGFRFGPRGNPGGFGGGPGAQWRNKWMNMSGDDKEKFKEEWKKRCDTFKDRKRNNEGDVGG